MQMTQETNVNAVNASCADEWLEPQPIVTQLLPVDELMPEMIPEPIRVWILDICERMQCPADIAASAAITLVGSIIGAGCGIMPKQNDDWLIVPNLYGAAIGRPGVVMKSPTIAEVLKAIHPLEAEARVDLEIAQSDYEIDTKLSEAQQEEIKSKVKKATNKPDDVDELKKQYRSIVEHHEPKLRRYRTNNTTTEKLSDLLNENPRGLIVIADELTSLLQSWDKPGREQDRSFYLEGWNGTGDYHLDRISRGSKYTKNMCVSIFGGIQPAKLRQYIYNNKLTDDGMFQRFQLLVYPDEPRNWKLIDRLPDYEAKNRAYAVIKILANMDFVMQCEAILREGAKIPYLRFADAAQEVFYEWLTELENQKIRGYEDHLLVEHLTKYRKLMPSLALIFHLIDVADGKGIGPVSADAARMAVNWCKYLESHAQRIYNMADSLVANAALALSKHIAKGKIEDNFTVRRIYRNKWGQLTDAETVRLACDILVEKGWLREKHTPAGFQQRAITEYTINPLTKGFYSHDKRSKIILKNPQSPTDTVDTLPSMSSVSVHRPGSLEHFEERAAIMEFDGNISREEAETLALNECFKNMIIKNR
jgi:hypothetical protein